MVSIMRVGRLQLHWVLGTELVGQVHAAPGTCLSSDEMTLLKLPLPGQLRSLPREEALGAKGQRPRGLWAPASNPGAGGLGPSSHLWLGTKSRKSRTWVASLERTMWPVNWPGENQKGKSGGSLSWNSAWILGGRSPAGSRPPTAAPKPGTQALCWGQGWAGRRHGPPSTAHPQGLVHMLPSEALPDPPLSSHSLCVWLASQLHTPLFCVGDHHSPSSVLSVLCALSSWEGVTTSLILTGGS